MAMNNGFARSPKLPEVQIRAIVKYVADDLGASQPAAICSLNRNTVNNIYQGSGECIPTICVVVALPCRTRSVTLPCICEKIAPSKPGIDYLIQIPLKANKRITDLGNVAKLSRGFVDGVVFQFQ